MVWKVIGGNESFSQVDEKVLPLGKPQCNLTPTKATHHFYDNVQSTLDSLLAARHVALLQELLQRRYLLHYMLENGSSAHVQAFRQQSFCSAQQSLREVDPGRQCPHWKAAS